MRDDLLALEPADVAWIVAALEFLENLAGRRGVPLPASVGENKAKLEQHLETRVSARVDARTRGLADAVLDDQVMDSATAAERLGVTDDAVRLACRSGRFAAVARKPRGRWLIPVADVEAEAQHRHGGAA